ncbi:ribbon-helix-helix domain-containing protein [Paenibacillus sp. FSL R7-0204]|uniref:ribbon-helix-helix domain-containing protein n=1 Tax=Paenibacillus sp. FSL R7-0204 TaxID=2921675 RepID=UPI0030F9CF73
MEDNQVSTSMNKVSKQGGARTGAGRKPIGVTRKISLTLPEECWNEIDRCCGKGDYSVSEVLRSIIEDNLQKADLL